MKRLFLIAMIMIGTISSYAQLDTVTFVNSYLQWIPSIPKLHLDSGNLYVNDTISIGDAADSNYMYVESGEFFIQHKDIFTSPDAMYISLQDNNITLASTGIASIAIENSDSSVQVTGKQILLDADIGGRIDIGQSDSVFISDVLIFGGDTMTSISMDNSHTDALFNVMTGTNAGVAITTGTNNVFNGVSAGESTTEGIYNTFIGMQSGRLNTLGSYNTFNGLNAGYGNTIGSYNTFLGGFAGQTNIDGSYNTFIGEECGYANSSGTHNTFTGFSAGYANTSGIFNTFNGVYSGTTNSIGSYGTFYGMYSGYSNTEGNANTFIGYSAGYANTSGTPNTFIGTEAGYNNTTGSENFFGGYQAGYSNVTGSNNIFIGYQAGYNETGSNKLSIENSNSATPLIWGDFDKDFVRFTDSVEVRKSTNANYVSIDTTNGVVYHGTSTVWDDLVVPAGQTKVGATLLPAYSPDSMCLVFTAETDDVAYYSFQLPHKYKPGTAIYPHIHWQQDGVTADDTTWQITMTYRLRPLGGTASAMSAEVSLSQKQELTYTSGSFHNIAIYPPITMTNMAESSYVDIMLYRKDADSGDANVYVKGFDIHYEVEKDGSANETP